MRLWPFSSGRGRISTDEIDAPLEPLSEAAPADVGRLLRLEDVAATARTKTNSRMRVVSHVMVLAFAVIAIRSIDLALTPDGRAGSARAMMDENNIPVRRDLVDRNGEILARNLDFHSLYADPARVWDPAGTAAQLATVLPELDVEETTRRLSLNRRFIWLARKLTPRQRQSIHELGLAGLGFQIEPGRVYPSAETAAHILGYTNNDLTGVAGIELALNDALSAQGPAVPLSIDLRVQHAVEDILARRMDQFRAVAASATLVKVGTGEVIAMASLPDYDPNRPMAASEAQRFNRTTLGVYELGSVFKPLTLAAALETGDVSLTDVFDASRPLRVGGHTIRDFHPENRPLTARESVIYSSNIATSRIADQIGAEHLRSFFGDLHLWESVPVELPEVGAPLPPERWGRIQTMTASFGHGFNVSPLALTTAYAALANGGVYVAPTLLRRDGSEDLIEEPVMSAQTAAQVLGVMRQVVLQGSGGQADIEGLAIAGKTGTAERVVNGRYDTDSLFTSFVAVFPFDDPEYVLLVTLDQPQAVEGTHGFATAGWNAAPTAGEIVERIAPMLRVSVRNADPVEQSDVIATMFAPRPGIVRRGASVDNAAGGELDSGAE